jgi:SAM-dependent methyltransferase
VPEQLTPPGRSATASGVYDPAVQIALPDDVADADGLRRYLADTDVFGAATEEAAGYLNDALERFRVTMALLPELAPGAAVLELGANPYFLSRLLVRRGLDLTSANWFGEGAATGTRSRQVVRGPVSGEEHVFEFDHFNVETERFPYPDNTFALVLCCEILEHLPNDPTHVLAEIHRVLQPGGRLLLTTPNAVRTDNLLHMLRGENVYEQLSGYGTYGRHNREYTVEELETFLTACGYDVEQLFALDIHPRPPDEPWPGDDIERAHRGDNLFAVATATGEPRWAYPDWLYSSKHALRRVVRPDLAMGFNDDLQSSGFHHLEVVDGRFIRWTGAAPRASALVEATRSDRLRLAVEGLAPPPAVGAMMRLHAGVAGQEVSWELACDARPFSVTAKVDVTPGPLDVDLRTTPVWCPADLGLSVDGRTLGVAVCRVAVEPVRASRRLTKRLTRVSRRARPGRGPTPPR